MSASTADHRYMSIAEPALPRNCLKIRKIIRTLPSPASPDWHPSRPRMFRPCHALRIPGMSIPALTAMRSGRQIHTHNENTPENAYPASPVCSYSTRYFFIIPPPELQLSGMGEVNQQIPLRLPARNVPMPGVSEPHPVSLQPCRIIDRLQVGAQDPPELLLRMLGKI